MSGFEWLVNEAAGETTITPGSQVESNDERWSGRVERIVVTPSLHVVLNDMKPRRDFGIQPLDEHFDSYIVGQVMIDGRTVLDFADGTQVVASGSHALLYRPAGKRPTYRFEAGVPFRALAYQLPLDRVGRLFGADLPAVLGPLMAAAADRPLHVATAADRHIAAIAARPFEADLNGPLRALMLEGAVLQLLALQAAAASRQALPLPGQTLSPRERRAVHEARDRLLADMRNTPTLGALADGVGLGERRLSTAFRLEFGAGPFEMLRDHRLEHARQALEQDTVSLKQVSFRVGYNHVSNFVSAFRTRYGVPPRQHREQTAEPPLRS